MAYIPDAHKKYGLLPFCSVEGGEVFSYSLHDNIDDLLPDGESVIPYGYCSYEEYYAEIDNYISVFGVSNGRLNELGKLLILYKEDVRQRNVKENWSVLKFIGVSTGGFGGFTHGRCYYFPCSTENPKFEGIIDDEEFTSYIGWGNYDFCPSDWEVLEDPTGMAISLLRGG